MGAFISRIIERFQGLVDCKILLLGLDAAGKTTVMYKLKLGETVTTIPTVGFNVEGIETRNGVSMTMWDVGGQEKIRKLWRHYFQGTHALVFVVDSQDRDRMSTAREELWKILNDELTRESLTHVLIYANKQDLPGAMSPTEIMEAMEVKRLEGAQWYVQPCVAISGEGLYEGMDWLTKGLKDAPKAGKRRGSAIR